MFEGKIQEMLKELVPEVSLDNTSALGAFIDSRLVAAGIEGVGLVDFVHPVSHLPLMTGIISLEKANEIGINEGLPFFYDQSLGIRYQVVDLDIANALSGNTLGENKIELGNNYDSRILVVEVPGDSTARGIQFLIEGHQQL